NWINGCRTCGRLTKPAGRGEGGVYVTLTQHYLESTESFKEAATRNPKHKAARRALTDCHRAIELLKAEHV
ncbi:MAG TPA: hypothetical protein VIM11_07925, partial [Tepidisphaeraceae bacterium]